MSRPTINKVVENQIKLLADEGLDAPSIRKRIDNVVSDNTVRKYMKERLEEKEAEEDLKSIFSAEEVEEIESVFSEFKEKKVVEYTEVQEDIIKMCDNIKEMLLDKNIKYGNSALEPKRIFSKSSAEEQILVRIDDKLSRMSNQNTNEDEDVVTDLIGYLILLKIARKNQ